MVVRRGNGVTDETLAREEGRYGEVAAVVCDERREKYRGSDTLRRGDMRLRRRKD